MKSSWLDQLLHWLICVTILLVDFIGVLLSRHQSATLQAATANDVLNAIARRKVWTTQKHLRTRIFSFVCLPLVCLCFGVSCELDLCPVSLASAVVALLATTAVAVFQYCLAMFLYGCHFALVARGSLLTFAHRWLIFAHVHSFGHLVDSGVFVAYSLPQCPENRRVWVNK